MAADLTISIVSFNTKEILRICLNSVSTSLDDMAVEVFVVDNGSVDGSPDMVALDFPNVKLIRNRENVLFTRANNQVIAEATGRYILILNSDTRILGDVLGQMIRYMDSEPMLGALGCKMIFSDGRVQFNCSRFHTFADLLYSHTLLGRLRPNRRVAVLNEYKYADWNRESERDVDVVPDSCILVRKEVFERIGLYDERMRLYCTEDDLCRRIWGAGWRIRYVPLMGVVHHEEQTVSQNRQTASKIYKEDTLVFTEKYFGRFRASVLRALFAITGLGVLAKTGFLVPGRS